MVHDTQSAQHAQSKEHNTYMVMLCLLNTLLVLTLTMRELRYWPSIAGIWLQSHCGDKEDVVCVPLKHSEGRFIFILPCP